MLHGMGRWLGRSKRLAADGATNGAMDGKATRADIAACFRLLLGREPNREELAGHMAQAGLDLPGVVAGYLNSLEFARRGLLQAEGAPPGLARLDGFSLYARADDEAVGRHVLHGPYEPEVAAVFRRTLRPGMGVVDIGANIGYFTMLSAALVGPDGAVLAIEPNPANARLLEASRKLNGFEHVTLAQVAAGQRIGLLALNATHSNGTTSAPGAALDALLRATTVACVPVDALAGERPVHLIKVDVEGAEYNALVGARRLIARERPAIISEFSPNLMPGISGVDGPAYLSWLHAQGYTISVIERDGGLTAAGRDVAPVMAAYERRGTDHIDLFALPG